METPRPSEGPVTRALLAASDPLQPLLLPESDLAWKAAGGEAGGWGGL